MMIDLKRVDSVRLSRLLFALVLVLGIVLVRDYGESWDERQFFKYADNALAAYSSWPTSGSVPITGNTYDNYGPGYVMLVALGARLLGLVLPWLTSDLRHLLYLLTFVVGLWAFHRLCRRWLSGSAALGATLLLATQPVIWGHAFISPKDVPFLVLFVLSLVLGLEMVDAYPRLGLSELSLRDQQIVLTLTAVWLAIVAILIAATPLVHAGIEGLVRAAASGQANIVSALASDIHTADPALYIRKFFVAFVWARLAFVVLSSAGLIVLWRRVPNALHALRVVIPAAAILGFATSIRLFGPLAGLMVAAYAIWKLRWRAVPLLAVYALIAAAVMYALWPYLWPDPVGHFAESVQVMARYPWRGQVLFNGTMYASTEIPRSYLPVLFGIQLTEPTWMLFLAGLGLAVHESIQRRQRGLTLLLIVVAWFAAPFVLFVVGRAPLYDNFRQVLFILPPVFLLAGLLFDKIASLPWRVAAIAILAFPGLLACVQLHPYEYIYYNRLIGGVQGAMRRFELDYWGTSYREAADYLNSAAPANATVWVEGPTHLLQVYVRPDLKIYSTYEAERSEHYDYVVALSRFNLDLVSFPDAPIVHTIERQGAVLTVIKKP